MRHDIPAGFSGESQDQLRNLADNLPDGMIYQLVARGDGRRFLYLSAGVERLFGVRREAALADAMVLYRLIEPEYVSGLAMTEAAALAGGTPFRAELAIRRPDGERRWLQLNSARRVGPDGIEVWDGIVLDVTARHTAEADRERTERRLEIATNAARIGVWDWNPITNEIVYSEQAKAIYGLPPIRPVTFAQVSGVTHPDDLPATRAASLRATDPAIRSSETYRYRIVRADTHDVRWVLAQGVASFERLDGRERATSYVGTILDITDDVRAEQALTESEARLRLAVEAGEMAVWELDPVNGTITPSPQLNRICGFPPDAVPNLEDLRARYAPGERERLEREGAETTARGETSIQTEFRQLWPDGTEHWLLLRAALAPPVEGVGPRVIGVLMDITDRKLAEERERLVARELQHRVKNSLAIVQTIASQSFRGKTDVAAAADAFFGRLGALGAATDNIVGAAWTDVAIRGLVEQVLRPFRDAAGDAFAIAGEDLQLPSRVATELAMALHELSTNAVKYGSLSVPEGRVDIGWRLADGRLEVDWRESGGPPVVPPATKGFGTRMLERGLFAGKGAIALDFRPEGLVCRLSAPV